MSKCAYITCFQTGSGSSATLITPLRYRRQAGTHKQSMLMSEGFEIWYSYPRQMPDQEAMQTAEKYADQWHANGRPSTGALREAVENGSPVFMFLTD